MARTSRHSFRSLIAAVAALALASVAALPAAAQGPSGPQPPAVPDSPTGLSTDASADAVTLSWDDPGDESITGYVILRRDKAVQPVGTFSTVAADTGTADTSYVDAYVERGRRYVYRVQAINAAGTSERSEWARGDTPGSRPSPERPAKPRGLAAETSHDQVTLSWDDPGDDTITGYVILRRDKDTHDKGVFETLHPDTGATDTTYVDTTAQPDRRYVYRVKALNTAGHSQTAWTRGHTPTTPPPENTPDPAAETETVSPPREPPAWVRAVVKTLTARTSHVNGALAQPARLSIVTDTGSPSGDKPPTTATVCWDEVAGADGYEIYILVTRVIDGTPRDWWAVPADTDDDIDVLGSHSGNGRVIYQLGTFFDDDTPSFTNEHLIIAVSAYNDTDWGRRWSDWRGAVLHFAYEAESYDLFGEAGDDYFTAACDVPVEG